MIPMCAGLVLSFVLCYELTECFKKWIQHTIKQECGGITSSEDPREDPKQEYKAPPITILCCIEEIKGFDEVDEAKGETPHLQDNKNEFVENGRKRSCEVPKGQNGRELRQPRM